MDSILVHAKVLWDYLNVNDDLEKADIILVCGGHDRGVADESVKLFFAGWAPIIVVSGGVEREIFGVSKKAVEADILGDLISSRGVPETSIIRERESKNTGENLLFTEKKLTNMGIDFNTIIIIQKPYAAKRALALAKKKLPQKRILIHTENVNFDQYINTDIPVDKIISMMVGEVQRLIYSPIFGWMDYVEVPSTVMRSYEFLCKKGYTNRLLSEEVIKKCMEGTQDNMSINAN